MLDNPEGFTQESELLVKATENPTEVIPPHIHTHVTYQPTQQIYDGLRRTSAVLLNIDS